MDPGVHVAGPWDKRSEADFRIEWFSGSGCGGQHRNKHQNSCRLIHVPTGLIEARQGRNRIDNLGAAKKALNDRLDQLGNSANASHAGQQRKEMVGSGQRGDKTRTIRMQADEAVDHTSGKRMQASKYMRGMMDELW